MKIWLDDLRPAPDSTWQVAKNYKEFEFLLRTCKNSNIVPEMISFDHDLGLDSLDGYDCIKLCASVDFAEIYPAAINVHSANPVGAENIIKYDEWFRKYRKEFFDGLDADA